MARLDKLVKAKRVAQLGAVVGRSFSREFLAAIGIHDASQLDEGLAQLMRDLAGRDDVLRDGRQLTSRMDELQAAVLRVKLASLPRWLAARQAIGAQYAAQLPPEVQPVSGPGDLQHLAVVRTPRRDALAAFLRARGIETKVHFPQPLHRLAAPWAAPAEAFPGADGWCATVLSLPCFPGLGEDEVSAVTDAVRAFAAEA